MKKITIATAEVFGATEVDAAMEAMKTADVIYRSDILANLNTAIAAKDKKFIIGKDKVRVNPPADVIATVKGYDADHPFVTKELPAKKSEGSKEIFRAWRYVAFVKNS